MEVEEKNSTSDNISDSESDFYGTESSHNDNFVLEEIIDLNNSMFIGDNIENQIHLVEENNMHQPIDENYEYNSNDLVNNFLNSLVDNNDIINVNDIINLESEVFQIAVVI